MIKTIFYKEWIKTRGSVLLIAAAAVGLTAYAFIENARNFRISGAVQVWNVVITKDLPLLPQAMQWFPALAGVLLALAQFVPEMHDKRFKLTLHLPASEDRIIAATLTYGIATLAALFILLYAAFTVGFSVYFPSETVAGMVWKTLPWFLGGWCAYLLAAWICVEPVWRYRITGGIGALCLASLFHIEAASGACKPFIPYLVALTLAAFAFPFYAAARFKQGAQ